MTSNLHRILVMLIMLTARLPAQEITAPPDSTVADSLIVRMMNGIGDAHPGRPNEMFADTNWAWSDIRTLPELFAMMPGIYQFEQGEEGRSVESWFLGGDQASEAIMVDGIPVGTSLFRSAAHTIFPLEFVQGVEELRGPSALLLGARWNLRSHQYASPRPRTAVRYVQSPNETIITDGLYTQNIARSTNLHFGFQRRTSGGRFDNAAFDSWALRARLRYNITPRLNVMGTWMYDKTSNALNGGVDRVRTTDIFDDVTAVVVEPQAYALRTSTALSFHALADILDDSLSLTRFTYSHVGEEREFNRFLPTFYRPSAREYAITGNSRVRLEQTLTLPFVVLRGMGQISSASATDSTILRSADRSAKAFGASLEARLTPYIIPSIGIRVDDTPEGSGTSVGASVDLNITEDIAITAFFEKRSLLPGLRQSASRDSLLLFPARPIIGSEEFISIAASWDFLSASYLKLEAFRRDQKDRLFYVFDTTASGTNTIRGTYLSPAFSGVQLSGRLTIRPFYFSGWMTLMKIEDSASVVAQVLPQSWAQWEFGWRDRIFDEELGLQITVRGTFYDRFNGLVPDPRTALSVIQSSQQIRRMTRLDGFIVLDIEDAFVTLAWHNIISTDYFRMATYPMPDRQFSLGVRWNFLN